MSLLTQREAATLLHLSERTLERFRVSGTGPKFIRLGRSIKVAEVFYVRMTSLYLLIPFSR